MNKNILKIFKMKSKNGQHSFIVLMKTDKHKIKKSKMLLLALLKKHIYSNKLYLEAFLAKSLCQDFIFFELLIIFIYWNQQIIKP